MTTRAVSAILWTYWSPFRPTWDFLEPFPAYLGLSGAMPTLLTGAFIALLRTTGADAALLRTTGSVFALLRTSGAEAALLGTSGAGSALLRTILEPFQLIGTTGAVSDLLGTYWSCFRPTWDLLEPFLPFLGLLGQLIYPD